MNRVHGGPLRIETGRATRVPRHSVPNRAPVAPILIGPRVSSSALPEPMIRPAVPLRARLNLLRLPRWPEASWIAGTRPGPSVRH